MKQLILALFATGSFVVGLGSLFVEAEEASPDPTHDCICEVAGGYGEKTIYRYSHAYVGADCCDGAKAIQATDYIESYPGVWSPSGSSYSVDELPSDCTEGCN